METSEFIEIILSFFAGGIMSLLIWLFTTKLLSPQMNLSEEIARRAVGIEGKNQYFIKIQNDSKLRNIYDITCYARYHFSNDSFYTETFATIPLLESKSVKDECKRERKLELKNLNLSKTPKTVQEKYIELANKENLSEKTVELSANKTGKEAKKEIQVNIDEFFLKEGKQGYLEMIVICYDAFSGAKRCVLSKTFGSKDILDGDFRRGSMKVEGNNPDSSTESHADSHS